VTFSPDGKVLASGSRDGTVKLWDVNTGAVLRIFKGHVKDISFSRDGAYLQTDKGNFETSFPSTLAAPDPQLPPPHQIFIKWQWVYLSSDRMLWIPPEYRPRCTATYGGVIAFGYPSGRVLFLELTASSLNPSRSQETQSLEISADKLINYNYLLH